MDARNSLCFVQCQHYLHVMIERSCQREFEFHRPGEYSPINRRFRVMNSQWPFKRKSRVQVSIFSSLAFEIKKHCCRELLHFQRSLRYAKYLKVNIIIESYNTRGVITWRMCTSPHIARLLLVGQNLILNVRKQSTGASGLSISAFNVATLL